MKRNRINVICNHKIILHLINFNEYVNRYTSQNVALTNSVAPEDLFRTKHQLPEQLAKSKCFFMEDTSLVQSFDISCPTTKSTKQKISF